MASSCSGRLRLARGSTWLSRCSASLKVAHLTVRIMLPLRHSNKHSLTLSRAGIAIQRHSLGAANAMRVATGPTLGGTAWEDQAQRPPTLFLDASVQFATTRGQPNATGLGN